ncbi:MAG: HNH endonuclease [Deltaproteobacteria bacterium]|jgi:5-methylcytosine-specific restriction endonuclease McrA|nr:HNH endonuclease [Deltaproteobacteria bacterium]
METLLLDATFRPIARVSWRRAITWWMLEKVEVLEAYEDREVRSVSLTVQMPAVVRLVKNVHVRFAGVRLSREHLYARDQGRCQYCGKKLLRREATFDHVRPRCQGGRTEWTNVVIACLGCNQKKGGRTPLQAGMTLRMVPKAPRGLPGTFYVALGEGGMPPSWRQYLLDRSYWNDPLDRG